MTKKKCPRCYSSMLSDFESDVAGIRRVWKCLGCGREILQDPVERVTDEQVYQRIRAQLSVSAPE